ncbi:hypothetical protein O3P69_007233 [Scylla paramamosain]|uniref:Uncharacterized protein n=1 Tax=Scylla paramamosain TaxID=85552 RepID=A0AAW0V6V0_SCYPA
MSNLQAMGLHLSPHCLGLVKSAAVNGHCGKHLWYGSPHRMLKIDSDTLHSNIGAQRLGCGAHWGASTSLRVDAPQLTGRIDLGRIVTGADGPATGTSTPALQLEGPTKATGAAPKLAKSAVCTLQTFAFPTKPHHRYAGFCTRSLIFHTCHHHLCYFPHPCRRT